jgi:PBP1b-binding outer membrane lipoprotein LpoB
MQEIKLFRNSVLLLLTLLLTGCLNIELNIPAEIQQNTLFTLSASVEGNEGKVSYQWFVDEELVSTMPSYSSMKTQLGDYAVTVIVTDESGNQDSQSATLSIIDQASLNDNFTFSIQVSDSSGRALQGADVSVNNQVMVSDSSGSASYVGIKQTELMIVKASKEGYITQAYQYSFNTAQDSATVNLVLQPLNENPKIHDASAEIEHNETLLNTKLILPANSFIDPAGNPVAGDIEIRVTPIDVRSVGGAFLGGAQGLSASGQSVMLISAGMADFQFSQNGQSLQLAEGIEANIEMDLVQTQGDDGRVYTAGDQIPLWWFDETTGFWIEDGYGTIQTSNISATGLKLVAAVKHFTTWNWDYVPEDQADIKFFCLKNGSGLAPAESCQVHFSSSSINKESSIGSSGGTIKGAPVGAVFDVRAKLNDAGLDYAGTERFRTVRGENTVIINLLASELKTAFIQCKAETEAGINVVPCDIEISLAAQVSLTTQGQVNNKASFQYQSGQPLDISATAAGGLSRSLYVDTDNVNGDLTIDILLASQPEAVTLACTASLNGGQTEQIYCPALLEDEFGNQTEITNADFSGDPLAASLNLHPDVQLLELSLVTEFDQAYVGYNKYNDFYYVNGESTKLNIDLALTSRAIQYHYSVSASKLYTFECRTPAGAKVNCDIVWYSPMETILYEGPVSGLDDSNRKPSWVVGKLYIDNAQGGFGNARMEGADFFYSDFTISGNRITFTVQ